jgi:hypothetical protein
MEITQHGTDDERCHGEESQKQALLPFSLLCQNRVSSIFRTFAEPEPELDAEYEDPYQQHGVEHGYSYSLPVYLISD